jgi:hypothetical protein
VIVFDPGAGEPRKWVICFCRKSTRWWLDRLPIGEFKHVRAFGSIPEIQSWVFFDPAWDRTVIKVARGHAAEQLVLQFLHDCEAVVMPANTGPMRPHVGGWCVPAVKQLVGLRSGALRPNALYRDCLANGGETLVNGRAKLHSATD